MSGVHLVVSNQLVLMDAALPLKDLDVAGLLEDLRPAPDGADVNAYVRGQPCLGDGDARALPGVGNEDVPEGAGARFEGVIPEDAVRQSGVGLNGSSS